MNFVEMLDLIRTNFEKVHTGAILPGEAEGVIGDTLSIMLSDPDSEGQYVFDVKFVDPSASGEAFVVRTYPQVYDGCELFKFCEFLASHKSRQELLEVWKKNSAWNVEINLGCVKHSMYQQEGNYNIPSDGLASMLLIDILNVVKSESVVDTIYDAYCDSYITDTEFDVRRDGADVTALSKLYIIPILTACFTKDWIVMMNDVHLSKSLSITVSGLDDMIPKTYLDAYRCAIAQIIKNNGNTPFMKTPEEKFQAVSERMLWATRHYRDYVRRRSFLRDEIIHYAMRTCSPTLRVIYLFFLNMMGMELHERYTGAAVEGLITDNQHLFTNPDIMLKYSIERNPKRYSQFSVAANRMAVTEAYKPKKGIFRIRPKLPSEKEIDMIFVDIDRMSDQYSRKTVLNSIYELIDKITAFEDYYSDDPVVKERYSATINDMLSRLDDARVEVLNKRSFKDNYKVFVNCPEGYEG